MPSHFLGCVFLGLLVVTTAAAAGSDGAAPPVIAPADLVHARNGDKAGWRRFCAESRGKKVVWPATVVASLRQFGDDYMESGLLLLDVDGGDNGRPEIAVDIRPSQVKTFSPGQRLTLGGILRGCDIQGADPVVRIEPLTIE
ncbi:MAG TPA: hypothetical protein VES39_01790 [Rhodospirillales bacterium]|jgi:hypothetical protein|nr:hypothetical protein [Rhodospirillales bacterium]